MRRHDIVSRILLTLPVITFALAAPVLVQEKRQACVDVDVVHARGDVITVMEKRVLEGELSMLHDPLGYYEYMWGAADRALAGVHPQEPAPLPNLPPPNPAEAHVPEVYVPPHGPADSDHESMELDYGAPPPSPESSTESEYWYTPPSSPGSLMDSDSERWSTISNAPRTESQPRIVELPTLY
jgi:hypothetical protein